MKTTGTGRVSAKAVRPLTLNLAVAALAAVGLVSSASAWARPTNVIADKEKAAEVSSSAAVTMTGGERAAQKAQKI